MSEYTPGPWKWSKAGEWDGQREDEVYWLDLVSEDGRVVIEYAECGSHEIKISAADARLIAAAPELLAECAKMRSPCIGCSVEMVMEEDECAEDESCPSRNDYRRVRALVARVRGEVTADE